MVTEDQPSNDDTSISFSVNHQNLTSADEQTSTENINVFKLTDEGLTKYILERNDVCDCIISGDMSQAAKEFAKQLPGRRSKKDLSRITKKFMSRCNQSIKDAVAEEHQKNKDLVVEVSNFLVFIFKDI